MMQGYQALTDKEKETLRLLLDGHDAKSMARLLNLSVHTINERLRDARRKFAVSSSREAARLLRQAEGATPEKRGDEALRAAGSVSGAQMEGRPAEVPRPRRTAAWAIGGLAMLSLAAALLALAGPQSAPTPVGVQAPAAETAVSEAARAFLMLVDDGRWAESYAATTRSFQSLNTVAAWTRASEQGRVPLGRPLSRTLLSEQDVPAPPNGYRMVRFRTDFAKKPGAIETVSLDRDGDGWKVAGVYIE